MLALSMAVYLPKKHIKTTTESANNDNNLNNKNYRHLNV
jgi:hypothetical protein